MKVKKIDALEILNSAGNKTIEVHVKTEKGDFFSSIPSGTSKSKFEKFFCVEDEIKKIKKISKKIKQINFNSIADIIKFENEHNSLAISFALMKALAAKKNIPVWKLIDKKAKKFPIIVSKMIGGGKHAKYPEFQEFLVFTETNDLNEMIENNLLVQNRLKEVLNGDFIFSWDLEGGWALRITIEEAFSVLEKAIQSIDRKMKMGVDIAASSFYDKDGEMYIYNQRELNRDEQIDYVSNLIERFNLAYIEDPLEQEDFDGFAELKKRFGNRCLIVGDDLTATSVERIKIANEKNAINASIIKPNQIYSLNETIEFSRLAEKFKYKRIISHRSEETCDNIISDIGFGLGCEMFKISVRTGERVSKINRLLKIKEEVYG
jgi:enolase